ncbi:hypothetical protein JXB28_01275 [Candidatus Woesearchaeota archaeon]|nr:hypothetical protein [Candidatus Woesearchaeota archaeon]
MSLFKSFYQYPLRSGEKESFKYLPELFLITKVVVMAIKIDAIKKEELADKMKSRAEELRIEEKARLIASELGKRTSNEQHYPEGFNYVKERYVGKAAPCSQYTLEIIAWSERDLAAKSSKAETIIYVRKPVPFLPLLYKSKLVYASDSPLGVAEHCKISAFNDKSGWLEDFELLYAKASLDRETKKLKALANYKFKEIR